MNLRTRTVVVLSLSLAALILSVMLSLSYGAVDVSLGKTLSVLAGALSGGGGHADPVSATAKTIILYIRLPRVLLAALVGGGLAAAGAVMQAIFKNPMAEPGVLGWASGGALAAVVVIYGGLAHAVPLALPVGAFLGTLVTALVVHRVASVDGYAPGSMLLLTGIAVGSLATALTTLVLTLSDVWAMREMLFWLLGGVDDRGWSHVRIAAVPVLAGFAGIVLFAKDLNAMALGEETAATLGVDVRKTQNRLLVLCSLIVGGCVAVSGVIGFVGLIVPHLMRLIVGANNRVLLPASFVVGAAFLPLADLLSRTAAKPTEIRLGVTTAALGVPFFLYLLRKNKSKLSGGIV